MAPILDEPTFRQAVIDHGPAVYRYAASRVGPDAAEDVMAEAFTAAWRSRAKFVEWGERGLEAWLIGITTVVIAAHRRLEQRWLRMQADTARELAQAAATSEAAHTAERVEERVDAEALFRRAAIAESIVKMSREEREPLLQHALNGVSYSDIARTLDVPIGTVRSRISRGRARLAADARRRDGRR